MPLFNLSLDASSKVGTVALTAVEDTVDLNNVTGEKEVVWCQADVDWFIDTASGAPDASRMRVTAKQIFPLMLDQKSVSRFFVKGVIPGTLVIWQPE